MKNCIYRMKFSVTKGRWNQNKISKSFEAGIYKINLWCSVVAVQIVYKLQYFEHQQENRLAVQNSKSIRRSGLVQKFLAAAQKS